MRMTRARKGFVCDDLNILTAQFHPEAAPGPVDSSWIFDDFVEYASKGDLLTETRVIPGIEIPGVIKAKCRQTPLNGRYNQKGPFCLI